MKITDVFKSWADDESGEADQGNRRTYQTSKDVWPKVTVTIDYPVGVKPDKWFSQTEDLMRTLEQGDQLSLLDKNGDPHTETA